MELVEKEVINIQQDITQSLDLIKEYMNTYQKDVIDVKEMEKLLIKLLLNNIIVNNRFFSNKESKNKKNKLNLNSLLSNKKSGNNMLIHTIKKSHNLYSIKKLIKNLHKNQHKILLQQMRNSSKKVIYIGKINKIKTRLRFVVESVMEEDTI